MRVLLAVLTLGLGALLISTGSAALVRADVLAFGDANATHKAPTARLAESSGSITIRDSDENEVGDQLSDMAIIKVQGVPELDVGEAYEGWFVSDDGARMASTGILEPDADGNIDRPFLLTGDRRGENLFADFSKFVVTVEPDPDPDPAPSDDKVYSDTIPEAGVLHIRRLLFSWPAAPPYKKGFHKGTPKGIATGLRMQSWHALVHVRLSAESTDIEAVHTDACHVVRIIEGVVGGRGADLDATCGKRGDGFGLLSYAHDTAVHARSAIEALPDDPVIAVHGEEVVVLAKQVTDWATQAHDQARLALGSTDLEEALSIVAEAEGLLDKAFDGSQQTYRAAQDMGQYTLAPLSAAGESDPKAPSTGDSYVSAIAVSALLGGVLLILAGTYVSRRFRSGA